MHKWEYIVVQMPSENKLNIYGSQGWELVAIDSVGNFYLKRPQQ